jgi:peptidoglycan/xylan/chitin deacetylase (PgdA/CDA1 family)
MRHARRLTRIVLGVAARAMRGTISHVDADKPVAALTFDDGPHAEFTPRVMDVLERHRAHATFFMIGERAHRQPTLVHAVASRGHDIANHSWIPSFSETHTSATVRYVSIASCGIAAC